MDRMSAEEIIKLIEDTEELESVEEYEAFLSKISLLLSKMPESENTEKLRELVFCFFYSNFYAIALKKIAALFKKITKQVVGEAEMTEVNKAITELLTFGQQVLEKAVNYKIIPKDITDEFIHYSEFLSRVQSHIQQL